MFKSLLVGIIGIVASTGGWFFGQTMALRSTVADSGEKVATVITEMTGAPIIVSGHVDGYVVFRMHSTVDTTKLPDPKMDVGPFLNGSAFEATYSFFENGITNLRAGDLPSLGDKVKEITNKKLGAAVVKLIEFDQFNYIPSDKIRGNIFSK